MGREKPKVLLIGERASDSSHLARRLEERGCECTCATSHQEACSFLKTGAFDLALSPTRLRDANMVSLSAQLEGTHTTLFYSYVVEKSCWWLPALQHGQKCLGSRALRGPEFAILLDEVVKQIQSGMLAAARRPLQILRKRSSARLASNIECT